MALGVMCVDLFLMFFRGRTLIFEDYHLAGD